MKKRILSIALAMTMLAGCSDGKKEKAPEETKPIFFSSNRCSYGNGVVFGYENATYLDFDTMEKAPLCAMPNCVHDNGSCLARIIGAQPVFYNDYVYYFTSNNGAVRDSRRKRVLHRVKTMACLAGIFRDRACLRVYRLRSRAGSSRYCPLRKRAVFYRR